MIEQLPSYISLSFILTTFAAVALFCRATANAKSSLVLLCAWLLLQGIVGFSGFYTMTHVLPPRFLLLIGPPLAVIVLLFLTKKGRAFIDRLDLKRITYLHTVRIPVELVLFWLYENGQVPERMTFEGQNLDILSGITAPFIAYYGIERGKLSKKSLLFWNLLCLGLLFNIVINAILSAPFPFQAFAFEQPNRGVFYFPFVWLPGCIVPLVLLAHLASMRQLRKK